MQTMTRWRVGLLVTLITLTASSAWAAKFGYYPNLRIWHANVFVDPVGQYQPEEDEFGDRGAFLIGGGIGVNRISDFAFAFTGEFATVPYDVMRQVRAEARIGWRYFTVGPTLTYSYSSEEMFTLGPVASFDFPIYPAGDDDQSVLIGVFYRLDAPLDGEHEMRQQIGIRIGYSNEIFMAPFRLPTTNRQLFPQTTF